MPRGAVAGLSLRTDRPRGGAFSSNSSTRTTRPGPWPRRRAGQEERNADHLLEAGAAIRCNNLPALAWDPEPGGGQSGGAPAARTLGSTASYRAVTAPGGGG
jgi:hypothetical protein